MLQVVSPFDFHLIKEIPWTMPDVIESTLARAYRLSRDSKKGIPAWRRIEILEKVVEIMELRKIELTNIAAEEGGKPAIDTAIEVDRAIGGVKIAIETISQLSGEQIPMGQTKSSVGRIAFTIREPIGVVVSISAFNHPLNLIIHQTVTAIAAGCPVIIKPALTTPLSCLEFMDILSEAGLPEGWCTCVICNDEMAEKLATDTRVGYFSFIGSAKVGWYLRSKLSPGTRCALEHGGVAPVIVEPDANIEELVPSIIKGGMYHAGQVCVSVQRVFIHKKIIGKVAERMVLAAEKLIVGDPVDQNTEVGPLILPKEVNRVEKWVDKAAMTGGKILCGGKRISKSCFEPTIILNPSADTLVSTNEVFGPIICLYEYTELDKAIEIANSLPMAFQASVFTKNIETAFKVSKTINASSVLVNDHTAFRVDWMPFGGRDSSGIGVGGIPYSIKEMTREKLIVIKTD